nr:hypothetical protein [Tanacetum cinerariifolium]
METSAIREYPSLIYTFFLTHTVGGVFLNPEDKAFYDEMLRLQGLGPNTPTGVPYTKDEIMTIVHGGKQRGYIPGVGRVLPGQGTIIPPPSQSTHSVDIARLKKSEKRLTKQVNIFMRLFRSDDKFSQMLSQHELHPEYSGGSGNGGCGYDEPRDDEDVSEDEEDEDDSYGMLVSRATCRPRKTSTVALNCLTETMWARRCRPRRYPIQAFPFHLSRGTCRPRKVSPATSSPGNPRFVPGIVANVVVSFFFGADIATEETLLLPLMDVDVHLVMSEKDLI